VHASHAAAAALAPGLLDSEQVIPNVDAANFHALAELMEKHRPRVVINCVGVIKQRVQAKAAIPSIEINSLLPHKLAELCGHWDGRLIHFSTDCVFSGLHGNYTESNSSDAQDLYGRSKYLGEVGAAANAITLRTSIIGRELTQFQSLLEWFLAQEGKTVQGYTRALYSGVTTNYLASLLTGLIKDYPDLSGLYQVTADTISKYDLLCRLRATYRVNVEIVANCEYVCDRSMAGEKFQRATGCRTPHWNTLLDQLASDETPYSLWRGNRQCSQE
jgi:dTDP-4-dehydrorhamnose reductase